MNHAGIETAINAWITAVLGTTLIIYWEHRPRGYNAGLIKCEILSEVPAGRDATKWNYDVAAAQGSEMTPIALGNRTFTLQLRAETHSSSNILNAKYYTGLLLSSLALPSTKTTFKSADIGYRSTLSHATLTVVKMEREISTTILQLSFHGDSSMEGTPIGFVDKWGVTSDLEGIDPSKNIDENMP